MERRIVIGCLGCILLLASFTTTFYPQSGSAQPLNRVGLVVQLGDGTQITRCIAFAETEISGYEVLLRANLTLEVLVEGGMGGFVCGIQGEGCPASNCMCDYPPNYWSYWHLDGDWVYSQMGFGSHYVGDGDVEGWSWGAGESPQATTFDQICPPPATDTPAPTATWTPSPTLTATWTPSPTPTATWTSSPIPVPTDTPLPTATLTESPSPLPPTPTQAPDQTPLPTESPSATDTTMPVSRSTTVVGALAAATTATRVSAMPDPAQDATPPISGVASITAATTTPTEAPLDAPTATPLPTDTDAIPEPLVTASTEVTATEPPRPTQVAVAQQLAPEPVSDHSPADEPIREAGQSRVMLTVLSVGAGVAYIFFALLLALLAGIFIVVRLRQQ